MVAIGAGALDVAVVLGVYPYEIACAEVVEVRLEGTLNRPWVQANDIILELRRRLTASGGKNKVLEFTGSGNGDLSMKRELCEGAEAITARIEDSGEEPSLAQDFSEHEREILVAGGLLAYLRAATSSD